MRQMKRYDSVDEYISDQPKDVQQKLQTMREIVKKATPKVSEKISYGIPYFSLSGRLVYFAAFKNHISFFPMKSAIKEFKKELSDYETSAGTVRFPLDKPLPLPLIRKIVEYRVKENLAKKK